MSERQQNYPDATGSRWDGAPGGRRPASGDRPAFLDRTEPMSQQDRAASAADPSLNDVMGSRDRSSRLQSRERSIDSAGIAPRRAEQSQWSMERESTAGISAEAGLGDPELAAASGMDDLAMGRPAVSRPPVQGGVDSAIQTQMVPQQSTAQRFPVSPAPQQSVPQGPSGFDEPTQLHNPVASPSMGPDTGRFAEPAGARRTYPEQVGDGVYRRSRPGLGLIVAVATIGMAVLVVYMLINAMVKAESAVDPSAVISGIFALGGLPLTAWGLYPLLGMGANSGPEDLSALLRPPYAHLLTGLALLIAAGLAA